MGTVIPESPAQLWQHFSRSKEEPAWEGKKVESLPPVPEHPHPWWSCAKRIVVAHFIPIPKAAVHTALLLYLLAISPQFVTTLKSWINTILDEAAATDIRPSWLPPVWMSSCPHPGQGRGGYRRAQGFSSMWTQKAQQRWPLWETGLCDTYFYLLILKLQESLERNLVVFL